MENENQYIGYVKREYNCLRPDCLNGQDVFEITTKVTVLKSVITTAIW